MFMDVDISIEMLIAGFLFAVSSVTLLVLAVVSKRKKLVTEHSRKLKIQERINSSYSFKKYEPIVSVFKSCSSKRDFENTDLIDLIINDIISNFSYYDELLGFVAWNIIRYDSYDTEITNLLEEETSFEKTYYKKYKFFQKMESRMIRAKRLNPQTNITVTARKRYVSPKGRKWYNDEYNYDYKDLLALFEEAKKIHQSREINKYYRKQVNASMRYDVLKRDGFRCVICGATAKDGAQLHVDHIVPVSRGGKTEMRNLRTLCMQCNLGKSNKYDEIGIN